MNLHPYDGVTRRFRHDDADPAYGRELVARIVGVPADGAHYDLSFYSGGIGVLDHLAISLPGHAVEVAAGLEMLEASAALGNEPIAWLVSGDEPATLAAVIAFVDEHRAAFQPPATDRVWFDRDADVNTWSLVYATDGWVHYLAYDQG